MNTLKEAAEEYSAVSKLSPGSEPAISMMDRFSREWADYLETRLKED